VLISAYVIFVICLFVPTVSYKRSVHKRDKKGRVVFMRSIAFRFSGRKLAASLVASCSTGAGCLALNGGSGSAQQPSYAGPWQLTLARRRMPLRCPDAAVHIER
jgi:hypothetical protein